MQNRWPRFTRIGIYALGTVLGLALSETLSAHSTSLPSLTSPFRTKAAFAQNVDEEVNIQVYQTASPAVVAIAAGAGAGSGSLVTPTGLILTNAHVVGNSRVVQVRLMDGREFMGDVVGYADNRVDLAAVQLRGNPTGLPTIQIAPPNAVQVGQRAFAIGSPFGLEGTFTVGIVSRIDPERGLIQTDAAINPGNSGGPLLDSNARLVGVNTSIFTTGRDGGNIGIGFAIPVNEVQSFLAAVRNGTASTSASAAGDRRDLSPQRISFEDTVTGQLNRNSNVLPDGSFFNAYVFEGRRGQQVAVEMFSQDLDSYLILLSRDGDALYLEDDDSAGNFNARLETTLPVDGFYIIIANSFAEGQAGRYNLSLNDVGSYILQQTGRLATGDAIARDGTLFDRYSFEGRAGQAVTIDLRSQEFDTYLVLLDSTGNVLADNDDSREDTTNSQLTATLPATGVYEVIVNGYSTDDQGTYNLTVR